PRVPGPRPAGRRTGGPVRADQPESGPRTTVTAISPNSTVSGNRGAAEWGHADGHRGRQQRYPRSARTDSVTTRPLVHPGPPATERARAHGRRPAGRRLRMCFSARSWRSIMAAAPCAQAAAPPAPPRTSARGRFAPLFRAELLSPAALRVALRDAAGGPCSAIRNEPKE